MRTHFTEVPMTNLLNSLCTPFRWQPRESADRHDVRFADRVLCAHDHAPGDLVAVAILGVPQDLGVQRNGGRTGAAEAPRAIREHFARLTVSSGPNELPPERMILDAGDIKCEGCSLEQIQERQFEVVSTLLSIAETVIVLGGGHDIAYPNGRALAARSESIGIVNVDAHLDVRPMIEHDGQHLSHSGSPFRQLLESADVGIPDGCFTEFGIQPFVAAAHHVRYVQDSGHHVMMLEDVRSAGIDTAFGHALRSAAAAESIYCSFDLDAVASAYAPGVSAPATDGFTAENVIKMARLAAAHPSCRLLDIVEANPRYDVDARTMRLAAQMMAHAVLAKVGTTREGDTG
ncbi:MAG: formimidoylglutamase [Candidatus Kapaibacterium sp.]